MSRRTSSAPTSSATAKRATGDKTNSDSSAEPGPVECKVASDIEALVSTHPMGEALSAMSLALARTLDQGAGLAVAAVNRELRANLVELSSMADNDDDLDADLSTPLRHPEDT
jgi:hypothetical protein